jgi:hypothetical protein
VTKAKSKAVARVDPVAALEHLTKTAKEYAPAELTDLEPFERLLKLSSGMKALQNALDPLMEFLLPTAGSQLFFKTDKDGGNKGTYSAEVIRDVLVEATLRGLKPTGNKFNIIASRLYITKEGYVDLVGDYPGLSDLKEDYSVPKKSSDKGAVVLCTATWKLDGIDDSLSAEIPVRMDQYTSIDAVLGKAKRKLLARVYDRITGSMLSAPEGDVDDVQEPMIVDTEAVVGPSLREELADKLEEAKKELESAPQKAEEAQDDESDAEPEKEPETAQEAQEEAEKAESEDATLDSAAIKRIVDVAKVAFPKNWEEKLKQWGMANYETPMLVAIPADAEADILSWLKRAGKKK